MHILGSRVRTQAVPALHVLSTFGNVSSASLASNGNLPQERHYNPVMANLALLQKQ